jgi:porphyrinogen peroxidase
VQAAPSTPGDLLFHIRAEREDMTFELERQLLDVLGDAITVVDETTGFRYFDARDLLGFVDGTANPTGAELPDAAIVGADADPDFAGGSYIIVQKYLHDMAAWDALTVEEQERAIGRAKLSNVEMDDDVKPANSHVALNTIYDPDGTQRQILRENMPFGSLGAGEFGTYFIGYAATPSVTELMLQHMFLGDPPGNYDRILDFSTALTGTLFFVPTADFLDDPPPLPGDAGGSTTAGAGNETAPIGPKAAGEGSLGIGGLRGESE